MQMNYQTGNGERKAALCQAWQNVSKSTILELTVSMKYFQLKMLNKGDETYARDN